MPAGGPVSASCLITFYISDVMSNASLYCLNCVNVTKQFLLDPKIYDVLATSDIAIKALQQLFRCT